MEGLALWIASETVTHSITNEQGTTLGVISRQADPTDDAALQLSVRQKLSQIMGTDETLFISSSWGYDNAQTASLFIFGSGSHLVPIVHASLIEKFGSRLMEKSKDEGSWEGDLIGWETSEDEPALWDILKGTSTSATRPDLRISAAAPPPGSMGIDEILATARTKFTRISPFTAHHEANGEDAVLVDIRPEAQRRTNGEIPGALIVERNVLEWRFDPRCAARLPIADRYDLRVIVFCQEGYTSSLAAASLLELGLARATDIDGGFARWREEGLPATAGYVEHAKEQITR